MRRSKGSVWRDSRSRDQKHRDSRSRYGFMAWCRLDLSLVNFDGWSTHGVCLFNVVISLVQVGTTQMWATFAQMGPSNNV